METFARVPLGLRNPHTHARALCVHTPTCPCVYMYRYKCTIGNINVRHTHIYIYYARYHVYDVYDAEYSCNMCANTHVKSIETLIDRSTPKHMSVHVI